MKKGNQTGILQQFIEGVTFPVKTIQFCKENPAFIKEFFWSFAANFICFPLIILSLFLIGNTYILLILRQLQLEGPLQAFVGVTLNLGALFFLQGYFIDIFSICGIILTLIFLHHPCRLLLKGAFPGQQGERGILAELGKFVFWTPLVLLVLCLLPLKLIPGIGPMITLITIPLLGIMTGWMCVDYPLTLTGQSASSHFSYHLTHLPYIITLGSLLIMSLLFLPLVGFFLHPLAVVASTLYFIEEQTGTKALILPH